MISIVHLFLQYSCLEKKLRLNTALCKIKKSAFAMLSLVTGSCGMGYRILSFKCSDENLRDSVLDYHPSKAFGYGCEERRPGAGQGWPMG